MSGSGVVVFDYAAWILQYPEFTTTVNSGQGQADFNQATLYLDNTAGSPIVDAAVGGKRETILYLTTAHVAQLLQGSSIQPVSPLVGQITNASEGSVSVAVAKFEPASAAWWAQTRYGLMAWQAMAPYRTALYVPGRQIPVAQQSYPFYLTGRF